MAFTALRGMKPFSQLMFSAFIIVICYLALNMASKVIAVLIFGFDSIKSLPTMIELMDNLNNPGNVQLMKYFQVVQAFGIFIIPPIILGWFFQGNFYNYLYLNKSANSKSILLIIALTFAAAPFINYVGELNMKMILPEWLSGVEHWMKDAEEKAAELTEAFLKTRSLGGLLFNLFMIALLPAIGEELLFRGVIQRIFTNMTQNHHLGIWISAILFSALHLQFYGFIPRMILGVMFGYLLVWGGSMWLPIIAHFLNNAFAVTAMFMVDNNMLDPVVEDFGSKNFMMATLSFLLILFLLYVLKRENTKNNLVNSISEFNQT